MPELRTHERYSNAGNTTYELEILGGLPRSVVPPFVDILRPGTRVLDLGSGPGNLTRAYAPLVAPAEVVGIDYQEASVEAARKAAAASGVQNVRFECASVYELPFEDGSFDVVLATAVFFHLGRPLDALTEVRRVLVPGGHVGLTDTLGVAFRWPENDALDRLHRIDMAVVNHNGGDTRFGFKQRDVLAQAGFQVISHSANGLFLSGPMAPQWVQMLRLRFAGPDVQRAIAEAGLATEDELPPLFSQAEEWAAHSEAGAGQVFGTAVARRN